MEALLRYLSTGQAFARHTRKQGECMLPVSAVFGTEPRGSQGPNGFVSSQGRLRILRGVKWVWRQGFSCPSHLEAASCGMPCS
ncbi:hypothetical protein FKM82_026834 [Ascaphus truei]